MNAFFGNIKTSVSNQQSSASKNTSNATKKGGTITNKDNPYGNKKKKIWIGADGGSGAFTKEIIKHLKKAGWQCHYSGEGANVIIRYW